MARWPCGSYLNLVWGLEVGRLPLIIQIAQNVIIRGLPCFRGEGTAFSRPCPGTCEVK